MNCEEVTEFLADYLEGALPIHRLALFKVHLAICPPCRRYLASYQETIRLAKEQGASPIATDLPSMPQELIDSILSVIDQTPRNQTGE
jgi:predicted anti-sigma-YlaC factor YlaD